MHDTQNNRLSFLIINFLLIFALISYSLPWIRSTSVSLSPGGYDLAEWLTLHPHVRTTSSILLPALLIRLPLALLGISFALIIKWHRSKLWIGIQWLIVAVIFVAQIPPVDFFRGQFRDPNYMQQALLWSLYIVSVVVISMIEIRRSIYMLIIIALGIVCSGWGIFQAYELMTRYEIPIQIGSGAILYLLSNIVLLGLMIIRQPNKTGG